MPLNKTKELAQVVDESILPLEHSGGDGWTILHGDTLQIIRHSSRRCSTPSSPIRPMLRAAWKPSEKNRTTNQKYSSMNPRTPCRILTGITGTSEAGQDGWQSGCPTPESLQAGSACLPVHRLAAVPFHHRRFAMGRMDLEEDELLAVLQERMHRDKAGTLSFSYEYGELGKPQIVNIPKKFNLSHSGDMWSAR